MPRGRTSKRWTADSVERARKSTTTGRMTIEQLNSTEKKLETDIQQEFISTVALIPYQGLTLAHFLYAVPNGGYRHIKTAKKLKAEGVRPGIPDIHCFIAMPPYHSLYIEMKTEKGDLTDSQKTMIPLLRQAGHKVVICRSNAQALTELFKYLGIK